MLRLTMLSLVTVAVLAAAVSGQDATKSSVGLTAGPNGLDPEAEAVPTDGVRDNKQPDADIFFKSRGRRYNYNTRYYPGYSSSSQCLSCGYGAVDYTTSRRCCQSGYTNCCFENNGGGEIKPGSCPYNPYNSLGSSSYCRQDCYSDTDCYGSQKCCSQGCSRTCQYPDYNGSGGYQKSGTCPYYGSTGGYPTYYSGVGSTVGGGVGSSYCRQDCYSDSQCPGNEKCCQINCSSVCVSPQRYY